MTNLVPVNVQQFQMAWQSSTVRTMRINFEKTDDRWKMTPSRAEDDYVILWTDKKNNLCIQRKESEEQVHKVSLDKHIGKKEHKKWHKLKYFELKDLDDKGEPVRLEITERGENFVQLKVKDQKGELQKFQGIKLTWTPKK
ncbi:hypothetical protein [uncultured Microscilla sp.]|uniref:hypothetical protein n=1 Tax=uncultured Microscilla sp. TaxID=432653 RepID=UPI00260AFC59|nr:hypothetical protein [uncultured Microscilla sp.]